jgi:hypothetical protein
VRRLCRAKRGYFGATKRAAFDKAVILAEARSVDAVG